MNVFIRAELYELENEINKIGFDCDNPIDRCDKSIETIVNHLRKLKTYVLSNPFQTKEDEIQFFKEIKPKFLSKLIYFKKVRKFETNKPLGSEKKQRKYLDKELNKLNLFFTDNTDFYNYYRLGSSFLDSKYFIRGEVEVSYNLETFYYEKDERFSTTHDFKAATIIANEFFQTYIETKISKLSNNKSLDNNFIFEKSNLKWTESKTSLIELIYALHTQKVFNNGKADLTEIAKCFEKVFDIYLGDIYRASIEIKNRKINKTKFIDILKENLNKRFEEQEYK